MDALTKKRIEAQHKRDQAWAELGEFEDKLKLIRSGVISFPEDMPLLKKSLNTCIGELMFRRLESNQPDGGNV